MVRKLIIFSGKSNILLKTDKPKQTKELLHLLDQAEAKSSDLPHGCQGLKTLNPHLMPSRVCIGRKLDQMQGTRHSDEGRGYPNEIFNNSAQHTLFLINLN